MQRFSSDSRENGNGKALLKSLDSGAAARLIQLGIEARFDPGAIVFRPHDESGQFYFITAGSIAVEKPGSDRAIRVETLHPGDFLGWSALLGSGTRHFQARALTRTVVLTFDGGLIRKACEGDSRFGYELMKHLLCVATERLDVTRAQLGEMQKGYVRDWGTAVA